MGLQGGFTGMFAEVRTTQDICATMTTLSQ